MTQQLKHTPPTTLTDWHWPEWLLAPWVAADINGTLWAFKSKPWWSEEAKIWVPYASAPHDPSYLDPEIFDIGLVSEGGPDAIRANPWSDSDE